MTKRGMPRRDFVRTTAAASAFTIVPRRVLGRGHRAPSDKLNVACIGVGGMGANDVRNTGEAGANIVALCDVDWKAADESFRLFPDARRYKDYRELLANETDIDAVTITTPDHTHAVITLAALEAGKHVYTQKPLVRTLAESRLIRVVSGFDLRLIAARSGADAVRSGTRVVAPARTALPRHRSSRGVVRYGNSLSS